MWIRIRILDAPQPSCGCKSKQSEKEKIQFYVHMENIIFCFVFSDFPQYNFSKILNIRIQNVLLNFLSNDFCHLNAKSR